MRDGRSIRSARALAAAVLATGVALVAAGSAGATSGATSTATCADYNATATLVEGSSPVMCQIVVTSSTTLTLAAPVTADVLVVGGGGGGTSGYYLYVPASPPVEAATYTYGGGGGGGGQVVTATDVVLPVSEQVVVGAGGTNGPAGEVTDDSGTASYLGGSCSTICASGGEGANGDAESGGPSGSDELGGNPEGSNTAQSGGGGGGDASQGQTAPSAAQGGDGGTGTTPTSGLFAGNTVPYGGGGGGGSVETGTGGAGGSGGGAAGNAGGATGQAASGTASTGGGGGGGNVNGATVEDGGDGGSGIVVIRFELSSGGLGAPSTPRAPWARFTSASSALVGWTAPASDGGGALSRYDVTDPALSYKGVVPSCATASTSCRLVPSAKLHLAAARYLGTCLDVTATAAYGTSAAVADCLGKPSPPTDVSAVAGTRRVTVSWKAPKADGGAEVTDYYVYDEWPGHASTLACTTALLTCTVKGLPAGAAVRVEVVASTFIATSASGWAKAVTPSAIALLDAG